MINMSEDISNVINDMKKYNIDYIIWEWSNCPLDEKYSLGHGGDEDFVIIVKDDNEGHHYDTVIEKLTVCDHYIDQIEGCNYKMVVTAHA